MYLASVSSHGSLAQEYSPCSMFDPLSAPLYHKTCAQSDSTWRRRTVASAFLDRQTGRLVLGFNEDKMNDVS